MRIESKQSGCDLWRAELGRRERQREEGVGEFLGKKRHVRTARAACNTWDFMPQVSSSSRPAPFLIESAFCDWHCRSLFLEDWMWP
jgi:hypothetical protein